ncbi:ATP-binding cassette domain-containing protein [Denitrobaculum tricleocarpae]|uniref:ATP-binding cassette domain-containing protein n=1 Tax=Denitrobaculum tricleocarpae TaxID=2591009 RepID=A0A545TKZ1_9PROT|nr:ATP-binding cassette domain-containing protein [Denitrobaculum tricleocarpae]TQV77889.1 ATP-binding cassette domain-containing protein [Denitrobaculum tricleocarpae]
MPETHTRESHLSVIESGIEPPAIALQDVVFERQGKALVDGLNLTLAAHGTTVLMGPNGAGKSLTLRIMAGLIAPGQGKIRWNGTETLPSQRVALVFQKPVLLRRSVRANLKHALKIYGVPRSEQGQRLEELLEMGHLKELADRPARVLSGGEQQRVALVRALAARPKLLLLDEPTASLDPQATAAIEDLIRTAAASGAKVLLVTHDRGQAQRLADEIVFLNHGRVTEVTSAAQFFDAPRSREGRTYLSGHLLF